MTAKSDLTKAVTLSAELDQVTAALPVVAQGNVSVVLEISAPGAAAMRFIVNIPAATLINQLTARQTALQNALTALGVV